MKLDLFVVMYLYNQGQYQSCVIEPMPTSTVETSVVTPREQKERMSLTYPCIFLEIKSNVMSSTEKLKLVY